MSKMHVVAKKASPPDADDLARRRAEGLARVGNFLARLQDAAYYGKVTISLQNGLLVDVRTEQVLKLDDIG